MFQLFIRLLSMLLNSVNSVNESLPNSAIIFVLFRVTIRSTLIMELALKLLISLGFNNISLGETSKGTTELIEETTKSLYLSIVSAITIAGLTFVLVNYAKGNGIRIISPIFILR